MGFNNFHFHPSRHICSRFLFGSQFNNSFANLLSATHHEKLNGEVYNVGSNNNLKNINIVKNILYIFKKKGFKVGKNVKIKFVKDRPGHDFRYSLDSKKIYKNIKWKSKTSLNKGLNITIDWYLKNRKFISSISKKLYVKRLGLKI